MINKSVKVCLCICTACWGCTTRSWIEYKNYDKAIIVSGDGDFHCLVEYLVQRDKLLHLMTPNKYYSRLFKEFSSFIVQVDWLKSSLELKKTGISGRSKP